MTTTTDLMAEEAEMSIHLLTGTYEDQGLSMEQTLGVLHKAFDLVPAITESKDLGPGSVDLGIGRLSLHLVEVWSGLTLVSFVFLLLSVPRFGLR